MAEKTLSTPPATPEETTVGSYRELMKKVERTVERIQQTDDLVSTIHCLIEAVIAEFRDELGIYGGRLYRREGKYYVLQKTFADARPLEPGLKVPATYAPLEQCILRGTVYVDADDPILDTELEEKLGVHEFACVEVGDEEFILAFNVAPGIHREDILFSLGILRHSINDKLRRERIQEVFKEARRIQASMLPRRVPTYGPFDLAGRTKPMETVGGDFYDYIPITDKILGLAIADVTGHGLPAALQTRDVYMGLRMGLSRDLKIVRTVERLNRIIHRSTLTSRFVSMFYGELELNGTFIFVNAGHPPPLHLRSDGQIRQLTAGGPVLGPLSNATYERGVVFIRPGDCLVLFTDGIVETRGKDPGSQRLEEFGVERLLEIARRGKGRTAQEIVGSIFQEVKDFSGDRPVVDDRTVVVVTYPES